MIIYHNRHIKAKLSRFVLRRNQDWMVHLIGIDLEEDAKGDIRVYPVYRAIHFQKEPDRLIIEIPIFNKGLVILLQDFHIRIALLEPAFPDNSDVGNIDQ